MSFYLVFLLSDVGNRQMGIKELGYIYDQVLFGCSVKIKQYLVRYTVYLDTLHLF